MAQEFDREDRRRSTSSSSIRKSLALTAGGTALFAWFTLFDSSPDHDRTSGADSGSVGQLVPVAEDPEKADLGPDSLGELALPNRSEVESLQESSDLVESAPAINEIQLSGPQIVRELFRIIDTRGMQAHQLLEISLFGFRGRDLEKKFSPEEIESLTLRAEDLGNLSHSSLVVILPELGVTRAEAMGQPGDAALFEMYDLFEKRFSGDESVFSADVTWSIADRDELEGEIAWGKYMISCLGGLKNSSLAYDVAEKLSNVFAGCVNTLTELENRRNLATTDVDRLNESIDRAIQRIEVLIPGMPLVKSINPELGKKVAEVAANLREMKAFGNGSSYQSDYLDLFVKSLEYDGAPDAFIPAVVRPMVDAVISTTQPGGLDIYKFDTDGQERVTSVMEWRKLFQSWSGVVRPVAHFVNDYCDAGLISDVQALEAFPDTFDGTFLWGVDFLREAVPAGAEGQGFPTQGRGTYALSSNDYISYIPFLVRHGDLNRVWNLVSSAPDPGSRQSIISELAYEGELTYDQLILHADLIEGDDFEKLLLDLWKENPALLAQASFDSRLGTEDRVASLKSALEAEQSDEDQAHLIGDALSDNDPLVVLFGILNSDEEAVLLPLINSDNDLKASFALIKYLSDLDIDDWPEVVAKIDDQKEGEASEEPTLRSKLLKLVGLKCELEKLRGSMDESEVESTLALIDQAKVAYSELAATRFFRLFSGVDEFNEHEVKPCFDLRGEPKLDPVSGNSIPFRLPEPYKALWTGIVNQWGRVFRDFFDETSDAPVDYEQLLGVLTDKKK